MTDRQALLSAAGKQRPYKAVNIKPPAMPGDIYFYLFSKKVLTNRAEMSKIVFVSQRDTSSPEAERKQKMRCGNSSVVEHHLAKVGVASSSLVFRSICGNSSVVEHHLAKVGVASSSLVFRSICLIPLCGSHISMGL